MGAYLTPGCQNFDPTTEEIKYKSQSYDRELKRQRSKILQHHE
jgi:hypothetical protein